MLGILTQGAHPTCMNGRTSLGRVVYPRIGSIGRGLVREYCSPPDTLLMKPWLRPACSAPASLETQCYVVAGGWGASRSCSYSANLVNIVKFPRNKSLHAHYDTRHSHEWSQSDNSREFNGSYRRCFLRAIRYPVDPTRTIVLSQATACRDSRTG